VFPIIRRPCTDFLTRPSACLPACLPVCLSACLPVCLSACAYLSMPTCLFLLSVPTVCAYRLCLPVCAYLSMPSVCAYRLCLPSVPTCLCLPVCAYCLCLLSVLLSTWIGFPYHHRTTVWRPRSSIRTLSQLSRNLRQNTIFLGFVCLIECLITKLLTEWRHRRHFISHLSGVYIEVLEPPL
jgi:hypothetical protein